MAHFTRTLMALERKGKEAFRTTGIKRLASFRTAGTPISDPTTDLSDIPTDLTDL